MAGRTGTFLHDFSSNGVGSPFSRGSARVGQGQKLVWGCRAVTMGLDGC